LLRFIVGLAFGLGAGAGLVLLYWWHSDQQQADALEGWEWTEHADKSLSS
jgi:hypothetical protein